MQVAYDAYIAFLWSVTIVSSGMAVHYAIRLRRLLRTVAGWETV